MGDAGSITLGFLAGTLTLLGFRDGMFELWVPIILFSPFIVDATVTLLRRAFRGEKVWQAHREHYYQRVVLSGWSHRRTVLAEYGVILVCGGLAVLYHHGSETWQLVALGAWLSLFLACRVMVKKLEKQARDTERKPEAIFDEHLVQEECEVVGEHGGS